MVVYIATDNPQSTLGAAKSREKQIEEYLAYGPPPRNYYSSRIAPGKWNAYADHSVSTKAVDILGGASKLHPCSDAAMNASPRPKMLEEFTFERPQSTGYFDPPLQYVPGQVRWKYQPGGWEYALAEEFTKKGVPATADQIKSSHNSLTTKPKNRKEQSYVLYHPADRGTAIFKGESAASLVARWGLPARGFSLVIVCPLVRADGIGWERIYDTKNRPPVYARWSTGEQAVCEPVTLMCIPKLETPKGRESYYKDVYWFSMDPLPKSNFETLWVGMWKSYDGEKAKRLIKDFGFPVPAVTPLEWTIVKLHRRIALGDQIADKDLGSWIQQFGSHITTCGVPYNPKKHTFCFDKNKKYTGRPTTYRELTGWILNPRFGTSTAFKTAKLWDDSIGALIEYNLDRTDAKWETFRVKMEAARTPPW